MVVVRFLWVVGGLHVRCIRLLAGPDHVHEEAEGVDVDGGAIVDHTLVREELGASRAGDGVMKERGIPRSEV